MLTPEERATLEPERLAWLDHSRMTIDIEKALRDLARARLEIARLKAGLDEVNAIAAPAPVEPQP